MNAHPEDRTDYGFVSTADQLKVAAFRERATMAGKDSNVGATLDMRHGTYGTYAENAQVAQRLKEVIRSELLHLNKSMLPDARESLDLICTKIARLISGDSNHIDTWHDIAGYAKLVEDRLNGLVR